MPLTWFACANDLTEAVSSCSTGGDSGRSACRGETWKFWEPYPAGRSWAGCLCLMEIDL